MIELLHWRYIEQYSFSYLSLPAIRERVLLIKGMKTGKYTNLTVMHISAHVSCYFLPQSVNFRAFV